MISDNAILFKDNMVINGLLVIFNKNFMQFVAVWKSEGLT